MWVWAYLVGKIVMDHDGPSFFWGSPFYRQIPCLFLEGI